MRDRLRRLRAAVRLGGFWGAAAAAVSGACVGFLQLFSGGMSWDLILEGALQHGLAGWLVGTAFAGTLIVFEARGILGRMTPWRIGLWGAGMGGVVAPLVVIFGGGATLLTGITLSALIAIGAALGAYLSLGTLRLAESVSRELISTSARSGLADSEATLLPSNDA